MKSLYKNIKIPALKGSKTIADSELFSYIDSDFKNWNTNVRGKKTKAQNLEVLEIDENGTFRDFFTEPEKMVLSQEQILHFLKNYKDKLSQNWYTFFLFKVGDEFFVALVGLFDGGQLGVRVHRFSYDLVWGAGGRRRVVVPQLTPSNLESSDTLNPSTLDSSKLILETIDEIQDKLTELKGMIGK